MTRNEQDTHGATTRPFDYKQASTSVAQPGEPHLATLNTKEAMDLHDNKMARPPSGPVAGSRSIWAIFNKQQLVIVRKSKQLRNDHIPSRQTLFTCMMLLLLQLALINSIVIVKLCSAAPSPSSRPEVLTTSAVRGKRAATARLDRLWDDAVIPYEIDPIFNDERASLFRSAMRHWENYTCIKFVERNPEEHRNYIVFTERSCGCCSFVGKRGNGAQAISIGKHCDKFGIVVHELGHVVGFWHEHTRPDRDQHVQIIGKNIMAGQEYNFNKLTKEEVNSMGLAYDYDSILHYATNTFAKDTYLDTILPLHGHLNTEEVTSQTPVTNEISSAVNHVNTTALNGTTTASMYNNATSSTGGTHQPPILGNKHISIASANSTSNHTPSSATTPHMINDDVTQTRVDAIRRQIDTDFQSMLQFDGLRSKPIMNQKAERKPVGRVILLDGSVLVSLGNQAVARNQPEKRRFVRGTPQVDADDGHLMLSSDNLLAKTRPEIGQRVRLSVGDIAQTNLLYKCPKCGRTIQQLSGMFYSPNYYTVSNMNEHQAKPDDHSQRVHNDLCEWRLTVGQGERIMIDIADLDIAKKKAPSNTELSPHNHLLGLPKEAVRSFDLNQQPLIDTQEAVASEDPMLMTDCYSDYLEIRDGYYSQAPLIAKLCGQMASLRDIIRPIISTSNRVLVTYRTTGPNTNGRRGFLAHHETICGGVIMLGNAIFDSLGNIDREPEPIASQRSSGLDTRGMVTNNSHYTGRSATTSVDQRYLINGTSPNENEVLLSSQTNTRLNSLQAQQPSSSLNRSQQRTIVSDSNIPSTSVTVSSTPVASSSATRSDPIQSKQQLSSTMWPALNSTTIQSPNWPEHYRASRECIWQIRAETNHQISLRFDTFDLEPHDSCAYDYVEIRDGDSMTNELLGRFCGNRVPSQVLSSGSSLLVKFVSDSDVNKGGFLASVQSEIDECRLGTHGCSYKCSNSAIPYRCECPNGLELAPDGKNCVPTCGGVRNDSTGQITSPSFPDLYPISTRCIWDIVAPAHHRITLNFTYFDLEGIRTQECDYDYVEIWSKTNDGKQIKNGIFCGLNSPFAVTSIANSMRVKFNSDNSIQKSGFEANYFIDRDECTTNNGGCQHICKNTIGSYQCSCNNGFTLHENKHDCIGSQYLQTITAPDGVFHTPNFPNTYQPNKEYAWIFSTAPGHRIKLVFDQFDLESHQECAYDHVAVFDGEGVDDHAMGRFCGSRKPLTLVSSFNLLYLVFHSDATNEKRGFNATHSTICGGRLQAYANHIGLIFSHPQFNGTSHYNRNEDCDWIIEANENQRVRIEFTFFALEADNNCNYDQTIIYDGPDDSSNQLARLCGTDIPKEQLKITSSAESMLIVFKSDDSINERGFSLTYTALEVDDEELLRLSYATNTKHIPQITTQTS